MIADPSQSQTRIVGKVDDQFCMLVDGCRVRVLMRRPYCTLDRRRFGLRMIGMVLALPCLSASHNWLFSLMNANCLGLRPPAAMTDG